MIDQFYLSHSLDRNEGVLFIPVASPSDAVQCYTKDSRSGEHLTNL